MIISSNSHAVTDIINNVSNEIPIATQLEIEEADSVYNLIFKNIFDVLNIYGTFFITSYGGHAKGFKPDRLKDRPSDFLYFSF